MAIQTKLTTADVLAIRDAIAKGEPSITPAHLLMGVRTQVHERLQAENPMPYPLPAADEGKDTMSFLRKAARAGSDQEQLAALHIEERKHLVERQRAMRGQVTVDDEIAFETERRTDGGKLRKNGVNDAHHHVQYKHGVSLWETTDALVKAAGLMGDA